MTTRGRPAYLINQWLWSLLDLLYPPYCGGCSARGARWCRNCQMEAVKIMPPICPRCGLSQTRSGLCSLCRKSPPQYTALRSWALFKGPVRSAIHRLKYYKDIALGEVLSRHLITCLETTDWVLDAVIPVSLGVARMAERGYNQASLLARPLALGMGLNYEPGGLQKIRDTPAQVGLSLEQRKINVAGSFQADSNIVAGKRVLLVDDVSTSGATLNACAEALQSGAAAAVYAITLARASRHEI